MFHDRSDAGKLLAQALKKYQGKEVVVLALPRGGVVTALEVAKYLKAPLDLVIVRKIGHPIQPEYAIAAIAEDGTLIGNEEELQAVDQEWLKEEKERQRLEAKRRRELYLKGRKKVSVENKIAILVDDGIATGLTMRVGIKELRARKPKKIVVAVPVSPKSTADLLKLEADEFVGLKVPRDEDFLGAISAYYEDFAQVEDYQVITLLSNYNGTTLHI